MIMRYYKIEIDAEVMQFLKTHAEPFEDINPNSVLRKLFLRNKNRPGGQPSASAQNEDSGLPQFSGSIPNALEQIMEVIFLVTKRHYSRNEATNLVARKRTITTQSVIDKYCRQLGKKAHDIDILLDVDRLNELLQLLKRKFPAHHQVIHQFFQSLNEEATNSTETMEKMQSTLNYVPGNEYTLLELEGITLGKCAKPKKLRAGNTEYHISNWTDLCIRVVQWLIDQSYLTTSETPIYNHANGDKYFINTRPEHKNVLRDGVWKSVGSFYIDTKYNAEAHKKNLIHTVQVLNVVANDIAISFR